MPFNHAVLRNFWPMALEKPTRGRPVRQRESFYYFNNMNSKYSRSTTYLCCIKCTQTFSHFLCQSSFSKFVPNKTLKTVQSSPRFLCPAASKSLQQTGSFCVQKGIVHTDCMDLEKCVVRPVYGLENCVG